MPSSPSGGAERAGARAANSPPAEGDQLRLAQVVKAFDSGDLSTVLQLTEDLEQAEAFGLRGRALANLGRVEEALGVASRGAERYPVSAELHFLTAVIQLQLDKPAEALQAARRATCADPQLVAGHFLLGTVARRCGEERAAERSFRRVRSLCKACDAAQAMPLSESMTAGELNSVT